jgi:AAA+ ATPase superfamily predicted ATPase
MKFYNRKNELKKLHQIKTLSQTSSKMSVIVGRRRIGKTSLIKHAYRQRAYLFVSKNNKTLLCEEIKEIITFYFFC